MKVSTSLHTSVKESAREEHYRRTDVTYMIPADTPPSLNSLPDQLHAATLVSSIAGTAGLKDGELRVAATTHAQKPATGGGTAAAKPLKRGFLDSKPSRQVSSAGKQGRSTASSYMLETACCAA